MEPGTCAGCPLRGRPRMTLPRPEKNQGGVLFLGGFPDYGSVRPTCRKGVTQKLVPFLSKKTMHLRTVVTDVLNKMGNTSQVSCLYGYACYCNPDFNKQTNRYLIGVSEWARCANIIKEYIALQRPDAILAMGVDAYKALGIRGNIRDRRGRLTEFVDKNGRRVPVVCTFDVGMVGKRLGVVKLFKSDVEKVLKYRSGYVAPENRITVLKNADEIVAALDAMNDRITSAKTQHDRLLAFDTETTSLKPHIREDKVIAMSFSAEDHTGLAFPYMHRECPHGEEGLSAITAAVERLLTNDNAILTMANGKFDMQWLWSRNIRSNCSKWDTMLAEHLFEEEKQGEYSLKAITRYRLPEYGDYEAELEALKAEAYRRKDERVRELEQQARDRTYENLVSWWVGLGDDSARSKKLGEWVSKGYLQLSDSNGVVSVQRVKRGGNEVVSKKYSAMALKVLRKVPLSEFPEGSHIEAEVPDSLRTKTYEDIDLDPLLHYAGMDAVVTRLITVEQLSDLYDDANEVAEISAGVGRRIPPLHKSFLSISMPLSVELAHMELKGIRFDRDRAVEYRKIIDEGAEAAADKMFTKTGYRFNPNAPRDLVKLLYTDLKVTLQDNWRTKTGAPSTDEATLKDIYDQRKDLTIIGDILAYRKLTKTSGTYIKNWLTMSEYDGRLHCEFKQTGTATYRLSSAEPNLQNVPFALNLPDGSMLNLKALFLPDDGYDIYDLDIKNAEMRVLCAYSNDAGLIAAFNEGKDLHALTAEGISGIPYEQILKYKEDKTRPEYVQRQVAKRINFGTVYCMGGGKLQEKLWDDCRLNVTAEQAQQYLDSFFATYPGVRTYTDDTKAFVDRLDFVYTFFGRKRRFAYGKSKWSDKERIHRQAVNARIQSTSSDMVMSCLIRLNRYLRSRNDGSCVLLTVHDSIPFQAPYGAHEGIKAELDRVIVEETAKQCPWLPVEWSYDCGWGPNYGETHGEIS